MGVPVPFNLLFGDDPLVWVTRFTEAARDDVIAIVNKTAARTGRTSHTIAHRGAVLAHVPLRVSRANTIPQIALSFGVHFLVDPDETLKSMLDIAQGRRALTGTEIVTRHQLDPATIFTLLSVGFSLWKLIWFDSGIIPGLLEMVFRGPGGDTYLAPPTSPVVVQDSRSVFLRLSDFVDDNPLFALGLAAAAFFIIIEDRG